MVLNFETFFGRFHPLIVHLPIGFLVLAVCFALLSFVRKYRAVRIAVPFCLLAGSLGAAFACVTGYLLSLNGDYDLPTLDNHMWAGIATTLFSFLAYLISIKIIPVLILKKNNVLVGALLLIFILLNLTGHWGGSLTHGSDYLSLSLLWDPPKEQKKITTINEAYIFADVVHPILKDKCSSCHNGSKKKGGLSIENYKMLLAGGKHGAVVKPGLPSGSELIKRVSLNPEDEKFMPTDGKTPLTTEETAIIKWWIEQAADGTDKKISNIKIPADIKSYAAAYLGMEDNEGSVSTKTAAIAAPPVQKEVIKSLRGAGFVIKYLNYQPDLLDVTLTPTKKKENIVLKLQALAPIKDNILWLNLSDIGLSDDAMDFINQISNLERLKLNNNPITDNGIEKLNGLRRLQSLNLYSTKVTKACLPALSRLTHLQRLYVWNTSIKGEQIAFNQIAFQIISGPEAQ